MHLHLSTLPRLAILCSALFAGSVAMAAPATLRDDIGQRALACAACHGKEGRAGNDAFFPRIAGKPAGYLYNQLINFRDGRRRYPAMTYLVAHLSEDYLMEMSTYFAALKPPYAPARPSPASPQAIARGQQLVRHGDAASKLPACVACHGERLTGVLPATPGLLGLPPDYINAQFGAWKTGARKAAHPDCMLEVSKQLSPADVVAVSAWLASQPIPADMTPASSVPGPLPIACGSAQQ